MARTPNASKQTALVLVTLLERGAKWTHGYGLSQLTGLKSGTIYPLLMRLAEQGFLESNWQESDKPGLPPRHVYRLTQGGRVLARELNPKLVEKLPRRLRSVT